MQRNFFTPLLNQSNNENERLTGQPTEQQKFLWKRTKEAAMSLVSLDLTTPEKELDMENRFAFFLTGFLQAGGSLDNPNFLLNVESLGINRKAQLPKTQKINEIIHGVLNELRNTSTTPRF